MLDLVYGPVSPCLEDRLFERIRQLKTPDPLSPVTVVTPSKLLLDRLQWRLSQESPRSWLGICFFTFHGLARRVLEDSGASPRGLPQSRSELFGLHQILLAKLARHTKYPTGFLEKHCPSTGLWRALLITLQELREAAVEPDVLQEAVSEQQFPLHEQAKLRLVFELYRSYCRELESRKLDDFAAVVRKAAALVPDSTLLASSKQILYYGSYDLTGVEEEFLQALIKHHPVTFFLPFVPEHGAFRYVRRLYQLLLVGAAASKADAGPLPETGPLGATLKKLFADGAVTEERAPDPRVQLWSATGVHDELWAAAKEILRLTDEEGFAFQEIAVLVRNLSDYRLPAREVFASHAIPYWTVEGLELGRAPIARAVSLLLRVYQQDFPRAEVLELLRHPEFQALSDSKAPARQEQAALARQEQLLQIDRWDWLSRTLGITRGFSRWKKRLSAWASGRLPLGKHDTHRAIAAPADARTLLDLLENLQKDFQFFPDSGTWEEHLRAWKGTLTKYFPALRTDPTQQEERENEPSRAAACLVRSLDLLVKLDPWPDSVSRAEFFETAAQILQTAEMPQKPDCGSGVALLDLMSARGLPFRAVFLLGLNEHVLPRLVREDPFLRDNVRRVLSETLGYPWIREKLEGHDEERLLFWLGLASATERVILSYRRAEEDGRPGIPSSFLLELRRLGWFTAGQPDGVLHGKTFPRRWLDRMQHQDLPWLTLKEAALRTLVEQRGWQSLFGAVGWNTEWFDRCQKAAKELEQSRGELGSFDGAIGPPEDFWEKLRQGGISPSALESLGRCPFQYFCARVLDLEPWEDPASVRGIPRHIRGNLYDKTLEHYYRRLKEGGFFQPASSGKPLPDLEESIQAALDEIRSSQPIDWELVWESCRREVRTRLMQFIPIDLEEIRQSGFVPAYFQLDVKDRRPPVAAGDLRGIPLHGILDRLDLRRRPGKVEFRVVDYKTANPPQGTVEKNLERARLLQLPIYLLLARSFLEDEEAPRSVLVPDSARFLYPAAEEKPREPVLVPGDFWEKDPSRLRRVLEILAGLVQEGLFFIHPVEGKGGHCSYCPFSGCCRKAHLPTRWRAQEDRRAEEYHSIGQAEA